MSNSREKIAAEIKDYLDNFSREFGPPDEDDKEYEADFLLCEIVERFKQKLLEDDYERTGNVLFLWEAIAYFSSTSGPVGGATMSYLAEAGKKLIKTDFPADASRYMLICDDLQLTGKKPPFSQYIKEKHSRLFLATYYIQVHAEIEQNGMPSTASDKNKIKKSCRIRAAKRYKYREQYDAKTYFNWVKKSHFTVADFFCLLEHDSPALTEKYWPPGDDLDSIKQITEIEIVEIFRHPEKYYSLIKEF